ncbi:MAG: DUF938 domain-containing protein [Phormidesmis sp.]
MLEARQYAPATERNRQPILAVLQQVLPPAGSVLEIASGTGEHATFFAPRLPHLRWIPTEREATSRASIQAWQTALPSDNLQPPLALDVSQTPWPVEANQPTATPITAIVNINMVHISPWEMCEHLMSGAERILPTGGVLYLYGPFDQVQVPMAPSNEAFDRMLRDRNPEWGIRQLEAVCAIAQKHSLQHSQTIPMPANNLSVIFHRQ